MDMIIGSGDLELALQQVNRLLGMAEGLEQELERRLPSMTPEREVEVAARIQRYEDAAQAVQAEIDAFLGQSLCMAGA